MKSKLSFLFICLTLLIQAQIVNIPDANFKTYLVGNAAINTNGDSEIQVSEATAFTGIINCPGQNISDLTGIEAFVNITQLFAGYNHLTSLDLSSNVAFTKLHLYNNQLSSINISQNTALTELILNNNQIISIDASNNIALQVLEAGNNQLTSIDVSNSTALYQLHLTNNQLTSINVNNNTALISLLLDINQLTSLDVSNNPAIDGLSCSMNLLTTLDVSNNPALINFRCNNNLLSSLNLANGNNTDFILLAAMNNPNLTCVQVDDPAYSASNWTGGNFNFDSWAEFSEDCQNMLTAEQETGFLTVYPNPVKDVLHFEYGKTIEKIEILDLNGRAVLRKELNADSGEISLTELPAGIYLVKIQAGKTTETIKISKK